MSRENIDVVRAVLEQRVPTVWTVHDGRVVRVRAYREAADALEAAGLGE